MNKSLIISLILGLVIILLFGFNIFLLGSVIALIITGLIYFFEGPREYILFGTTLKSRIIGFFITGMLSWISVLFLIVLIIFDD